MRRRRPLLGAAMVGGGCAVGRHDAGLLSREEFDREKQRILSEFVSPKGGMHVLDVQ